jgi:hypothetical protein
MPDQSSNPLENLFKELDIMITDLDDPEFDQQFEFCQDIQEAVSAFVSPALNIYREIQPQIVFGEQKHLKPVEALETFNRLRPHFLGDYENARSYDPSKSRCVAALEYISVLFIGEESGGKILTYSDRRNKAPIKSATYNFWLDMLKLTQDDIIELLRLGVVAGICDPEKPPRWRAKGVLLHLIPSQKSIEILKKMEGDLDEALF